MLGAGHKLEWLREKQVAGTFDDLVRLGLKPAHLKVAGKDGERDHHQQI